MNYGWCSSYQKDWFRQKQEQPLGLLDPIQNPNTTVQLSSIGDNQQDDSVTP